MLANKLFTTVKVGNNIGNQMTSLFADECVNYREIKGNDDTGKL